MSHSLGTAYRNQRGISLLEILLAIAIIAIVMIYFSRIIHFADTGNRADEGRERMEQVAIQLKAFYRSQQMLPDPIGDPPTSVPVGAQQLNLSQKHRLDPWGNYLLYFRAQKQDAYYTQATITDIIGFEVDGRRAGGVLISLGPNQVKDYTEDVPDNPTVFTSRGDDLLVPITMEEEAWDIVMEELEFLDKRVVAYDRFFAGVNNGGDHIYVYNPPPPIPPCTEPYRRLAGEELRSYYLMDEGGCEAADWPATPGNCLPTGETMQNDPNCGRATIDICPTALNEILQLYVYGGNVTAVTEPYHTDPWGNLYQWGSEANLGVTNPQSDRRYHVFYSKGADPDDPNDDITPY